MLQEYHLLLSLIGNYLIYEDKKIQLLFLASLSTAVSKRIICYRARIICIEI